MMLKRSANRTTFYEWLLYAHSILFNIVVGCIHIKTLETSANNDPMLILDNLVAVSLRVTTSHSPRPCRVPLRALSYSLSPSIHLQVKL